MGRSPAQNLAHGASLAHATIPVQWGLQLLWLCICTVYHFGSKSTITQTLSKHSCTAVDPADPSLKAKHPGLAQEVIQAIPEIFFLSTFSFSLWSDSITSLQNGTGSGITADSALGFDPNANNVLKKSWAFHIRPALFLLYDHTVNSAELNWGQQGSDHRKL